MAPLGPPEMTGYLMLLAVCLAVYTWTRNRIVSLTPWILSIILTIWPILRDTVQTALWNLTSNPIFWGHAYPDAYYLWWSILTILVRLIVLGFIHLWLQESGRDSLSQITHRVVNTTFWADTSLFAEVGAEI